MDATHQDLPAGTGLHHHRAASLTALAARLAELWREPHADPFAFDLAVVPAAGVQRWLTQQLAGDGEGICAGIEFVRPADFERRLRNHEPDPWAPEAALWRLAAIVEAHAGDPQLTRLSEHLAASRDPFAACWGIARRFDAYAEWRQPMLAAWADGRDLDAAGKPLGAHAWQAHLWRLLRTDLGGDPVVEHRRLTARLAEGRVELPDRIAVFAPSRLSPRQAELLQAVAIRHRVDLLISDVASGRKVPPGRVGPSRRDWSSAAQHPLNRALGTASEQALALLGLPAETDLIADPAAEPDSLLGWLQADLRADRPGPVRTLAPGDDSIQVHLSHGLDRQVEVLRDTLAGLFQADPTLEPRQVAVLTPDPDAVAPLVQAAFGLQPSAQPQHPGHQLRIQLSQRTAAQTNPLVGLLIQVLSLVGSRASASELLDLCAEPMVARRFGFTGDRHDRLAELVGRAGIRWGLNSWHRAGFGLDGIPQNTWTAGLQRLLLGVSLSEEDLVTAKTAFPVDDVDSSDVALIGGLAELISRLSRLIREFEIDTDLAGWAERCRATVVQLVALEPAEQGWLAELGSGLHRMQRAAGDSPMPLPRAAAVALVRRHFENQPARSTYGNGSLVVTGLEALRGVPHRVVCLLGWDADRFPRRRQRHGDDVLAAEPWLGDPDPAADDRQLLLDAVHAATEKLVVVCAGRSPATNEEVPLAAPLAEFVSGLDQVATTVEGTGAGQAVCIRHRLQPFDERYFAGSELPRSFDPIALIAAEAAHSPPAAEPTPYHQLELPAPATDVVAISELISFFNHPVRHLVRLRTGLSFADSTEPTDEIPTELDGLQQWSIGNRALTRALAGHGPDQVLLTERLRGDLPPAELGRRALNRIVADIDAVLDRLPSQSGEPAVDHDLALDIAGVQLTGQVQTRGELLISTEYSSLSAKHKLSGWLRLLALTAAEPASWRSLIVTKTRVGAWQAPDPERAARLLADLVAIYRRGICHPLPLPPRLGESYASLRANQIDPADPRRGEPALRRTWEFDSDAYWLAFFDFPELLRLPRDPADSWGPAEETTALGSLARAVWDPIRDHQVAP